MSRRIIASFGDRDARAAGLFKRSEGCSKKREKAPGANEGATLAERGSTAKWGGSQFLKRGGEKKVDSLARG